MANHDDFADEYIEYRIFEESMEDSGRRSPKKNSGCGCLTIAIIVCIVIAVIMLCCLFWG